MRTEGRDTALGASEFPITHDLRDKLWRCWNRGDGLQDASQSLARTAGVKIDRETIRRHFVAFADEYAGQTERAA